MTMEKTIPHDSIATVTIKSDYPPSEIYSTSEPPPAYIKPKSSSVQIAKIIAGTVVLVSIILGCFILASAYVNANASCKQLEQELALLSEVAERFQAPLQPEALVQDAPHAERLQGRSDDEKHVKEIDNNIDETNESEQENEVDEPEDKKIRFKIPLQLDFDDLAGELVQNNKKSRMNCVVEKKRAEQMIDHQPKTLNLPFGLNITTDPRFERVTGERMAIFCESGDSDKKSQESDESDSDEDADQETIMIQPVMIPIPHSPYPTHMAQQMLPQQQSQYPTHMTQQMVPQQQPQPQQQEPIPQAQVVEQIIVEAQPQYQRQPIRPIIRPVEGVVRMGEDMGRPDLGVMRPPQYPTQSNEESNDLPPVSVLRHIAQQIMLRKEQEQRQNEEQNMAHKTVIHPVQENGIPQRIPIPEALLSQLDKLPQSRGGVVIALTQDNQRDQQPAGEIRMVQLQRQGPQEMNGRQTYARGLSHVNIPVPMMQHYQQPQENTQPEVKNQETERESEQEPEQQADELRPQYIPPRSIKKRSVDNLLANTKRVKRCACDCAC